MAYPISSESCHRPLRFCDADGRTSEEKGEVELCGFPDDGWITSSSPVEVVDEALG